MRHRRINCRVSQREYDIITAASKQAGMPRATFIRAAALAHIEGQFIVPPSVQEGLAHLTAELRRMGNNLNQIARRTNTFQRATIIDLYRTRRILDRDEDLAVASISRSVPSGPEPNPGFHGHQVSLSQEHELPRAAPLHRVTEEEGDRPAAQPPVQP